MRLYSGIDIIILCRDLNSLQFEINSYPRGKDSSPGEIPKCPVRRLVRWSRVWGTTVEVQRVFLCLPGGGGHWALGHPKVRQSLGLSQVFFCLRLVFLASTLFSLEFFKDSSCTQDGDSSPGCPRFCNVCNFCASPWMLSRAEVVSMYIFHP